MLLRRILIRSVGGAGVVFARTSQRPLFSRSAASVSQDNQSGWRAYTLLAGTLAGLGLFCFTKDDQHIVLRAASEPIGQQKSLDVVLGAQWGDEGKG